MAEYFQDPYDDPKHCTAYANDAFQTNESVSVSEYEAGHRVLKWGTEPPSMLYKTAASSVPIEIWDRVIDCLREEPATLRATETRWVIPPNLRSLRLGRFGAASPEVLRGLVSIRLTTHCERLELEFVLNSMSDYSVQLLLRSARQSLQELTVNVSPLLNLGGLEARDMVERCLNLSVSSQLSVLTMYIRLEGDTILLARNYDRIVALVNYAPAATLEQVKLNWTCSMEFMKILNIRQELLRLCQEISQIDQILSHRRYIRLKQVKIEFWGIGGLWEEMGSIWMGLAPLWFPNMLSKGVLRATWNGQLLLNNKI
ncbi:hypothetical protein WOLCODRAFT_142747 [Wolfiporia cocos MD-104 SS10]|uniref:F-box domain-containing protein n=1 Tax=Wolfiporia cocos (strain MD-104) TaxID=742152 RepID=A0A2H3J982_WOLCO|nr:hypothetical protein WOLCODRAFT_142747 [Wolfiporia cocos MD-104 SS10]